MMTLQRLGGGKTLNAIVKEVLSHTFESFLLTKPPCSSPEWTSRYEASLKIASRDKLPNRPDRSAPR